MTVTAQNRPSGVRDWWLRVLLVLQRPRPVFVALRDESRESLSDRSEQVLLIVWLSGIAYALASPTASHLMDDSSYDGLLVAMKGVHPSAEIAELAPNIVVTATPSIAVPGVDAARHLVLMKVGP